MRLVVWALAADLPPAAQSASSTSKVPRGARSDQRFKFDFRFIFFSGVSGYFFAFKIPIRTTSAARDCVCCVVWLIRSNDNKLAADDMSLKQTTYEQQFDYQVCQ